MREKEGLNQTLRVTSETGVVDRGIMSKSEDRAMSLKVINHSMIDRSLSRVNDASPGHGVLTKA